MIINRIMQPRIESGFFKGKIIIIYGARQVGKTTLVKEICKKYPDSSYFSCDEPDVREALTDKTSTEIKAFFGGKKLLVLDEAQRVRNIGLSLKLMADNFPDWQVIATGSSSFDLSNKIAEPLTGRKIEFYLYSFSLAELAEYYSVREVERLLERFLIYGTYPEIIKNEAEAPERLKELAQSYAYKDVLQYQNIKKPEILEKLLRALALQVGQEVSYNELAGVVGADKNTIASYVQILEKAFIIFRLSPFSRNLRNELKKLRKIYFFDNGLRNALINNLNPLNLRADTGALWENFLISERIKFNNNRGLEPNMYFWRTISGQEIDYLEDAAGSLKAFEFKWTKDKAASPKPFAVAYPDSQFSLINKNNYRDFLS